jgi:hypothetical protein
MEQTPTREPIYHVRRAYLLAPDPWSVSVSELFGYPFRVILCGACQGGS